MSKKHYIEGDGNGGYKVSKSVIAIISFLLLLGGVVAARAYDYGTLNQRVDILEDQQEVIMTLSQKVVTHDTNIAVIDTKLDTISSDITEIKDILKSK